MVVYTSTTHTQISVIMMVWEKGSNRPSDRGKFDIRENGKNWIKGNKR